MLSYYSTGWAAVIVVPQLCKLLHVFGMASMGIFTCILMVFAFSLPVFVHMRLPSDCDDDDDDSGGLGANGLPTDPQIWSQGASNVELAAYALCSFIAVMWARGHGVMESMLSAVTMYRVTDGQVSCACASLWFGNMGLLFLLFRRKSTVLRR